MIELLRHATVILWALGAMHAPESYADACPEGSAVHFCVYQSPDEPTVIAMPTRDDCSTFRLGVVLGTLSGDVLRECQ